ncbi:MAG: D-alanyl-D-alanine carboxypeptidase [Bacilli bacterium]|nr:D-alanyl-D-alanine carboxypeptidase [Bacilli bacterium]
MKKVLFFLLCSLLVITNVYASNYVVMDMGSGRVLASRSMNEEKLIASITKIMTCIIILENNDLDKEVVVGEEILKMYGTNIYIEVGEKIKVIDLLYGLMLRSGNDAAITLAINTSGSEDEFVALMNEKALEIGMNNTKFSNAHGLDDNSQNYSTAYDMALLSRYAFNNKKYREIINTKKYVAKSSLKTYVWYNRMSLLNNYKYCIGGKNGYTPKAGKTLVSVAEKEGVTLTIVSLDDNDIYETHEYLYDKYFDKYKLYTIVDKDKFMIDKTLYPEDIYLKKSFKYLLTSEESDLVSTFIKLNEKSNNNVVGEIIISLDNKEIGRLDIYKYKKKKDRLTIFQKFKNLIIR